MSSADSAGTERGYRFTSDLGEAASKARDEPQADVLANNRPATNRFRGTRPILVALVLGLAAIVYWQFYRPSRFLPRIGGAASIAVIPVECLSPDLDQVAFSEGFTEALVGEIAKLKSAQLISPSTVRRYRRLRIPTAVMTRLLGLHVIVEGTAQTFGQQIRLSVRLTDVHSGKLIWAEGYDVAPADMNQAELMVARAVAAEIGRRLSPQ